MQVKKMWKVYILETKKGALYTGITNDLEKRMATHKKGRGALFTRLCGVKELLYSENRRNRSFASKREAEIKKWPRKKKLELIKGAKDAYSKH
jgi:putative endonuclease